MRTIKGRKKGKVFKAVRQRGEHCKEQTEERQGNYDTCKNRRKIKKERKYKMKEVPQKGENNEERKDTR